MTLRARLALGLFVFGILLIIPGVLARQGLLELGRSTRALREGEFAASLLLGRLRGAAGEFEEAERALGVDTASEAHTTATRTLARVQSLVDSLPPALVQGEQARLRTLAAPLAGWVQREHDAMRAGSAGLADTISADSVAPVLLAMTKGIRRAETTLGNRMATAVDHAAVSVDRAQERLALAFVLAALLATGVAAALTATISRPVRDLQEGMARVADGEFEYQLAVATTRRDEFGRLAHSYQAMTRQLAALDKLKAEFISVASHELKTPINVILGYVQLLEEGLYGDMNERQRDVLSILDSQCQTLSRLVRHLLDISRFEAGGGRLELRTLVLGQFLDDLERAFAVLARQKEVRFSITRGPDVPATVSWDPDRMNEVLGNLLSNAFKFTSRGGHVDLVVASDGANVQIEVRDSGAGIAADQLPRVFEKFYQADNQAAASMKGTGLGLAIAKSIVEAHGGSIACDSAPGVGTCFAIALPAVVSARRAGTPGLAVAPAPARALEAGR